MKLNADQETHPKYWCRLKNESCGWQHKVKMFCTNIRKRNKKNHRQLMCNTHLHTRMHRCLKKKREQSFLDLLSENKQTKISLSWYHQMDAKVIFTFVHIFFSQTKTFSFTRDIHWTYISIFYFPYCWSFSFDLFVDAFVCCKS